MIIVTNDVNKEYYKHIWNRTNYYTQQYYIYMYIGTLPIETKKAQFCCCILANANTESPLNQFTEDMIIEIVFNFQIMVNLKNTI